MSGDQLPSVRELSERLNVNPNTVAKAYRDLELMGLVAPRRGVGVRVTELPITPEKVLRGIRENGGPRPPRQRVDSAGRRA